jgi:lycopene cyclase domain-containing protein
MGEYLLLNILVISVPLILTFEKKLTFYKNIFPLFISIFTVGGSYIVWDIFATARGDWDFNPEYLISIKIFNLPLEEILFFVTVPYGIIFLYETFIFYSPSIEEFKINTYYILMIGIIIALLSILFSDQPYTFYVILSVGLFFIASPFIYKKLLQSVRFWQFIILTYIPFFAMNYILTSLPIVTYGENAIWGNRILTIPVEDFLYSFSLLSFYLLIYSAVKDIWLKRKFV